MEYDNSFEIFIWNNNVDPIDNIFSTRTVQSYFRGESPRKWAFTSSDRTGGKNVIHNSNIIVSYGMPLWVDSISTLVCVKMLRFDGAMRYWCSMWASGDQSVMGCHIFFTFDFLPAQSIPPANSAPASKLLLIRVCHPVIFSCSLRSSKISHT